MKSILDFNRARQEGRPIVMVTAYDAPMARLVAESEADVILVGDSAAMVVHGLPSTVHATLDMMVLHTAAVRRGAPDRVIVADLPFLSFRQGRETAVRAAGALIQAGATAVKLEGVTGHEDVVAHLVGSGIPVMGHLGLTPQSIYKFGTFTVRAREEAEARKLIEDAHLLEDAGCFAIVLEKIPAELATRVAKELTVPVIGIGAGSGVDGQVLVTHDMLGLTKGFSPRFIRKYLDLYDDIKGAVSHYIEDVKLQDFPNQKEQY